MKYFPLKVENAEDFDDLFKIKGAVAQWLWTKAEHEFRYAEQKELLRQLSYDALHSGLLERLLQGQEPEKEPPHD